MSSYQGRTVLYFSYGSNMSKARLRARVPLAKAITTATLAGHKLLFHKIGKDSSGKCDAYETAIATDKIIGVVYELSKSEKLQLDRFEGLGYGYTEKEVSLVTPDNTALKAITYVATRIDRSLKPFGWYKIHVITGAEEHCLPSDYILSINAFETVDDPDHQRHQLEMSIYR